MAVLEKISTPSDIKSLKISELDELAEEIRNRIIDVVYKNGGHLSSNLGLVDVIVALYYVYDFPNDKLIFDVGHQSYAHKILSGRNGMFDTIRQKDGLSGFPNIFESEFDAFSSGHAGNSISATLGYAAARDIKGDKYNIVDVVGDASLFNGENLEAITCSDVKPENTLVIINDNGMSISRNNNGMYKLFSKITTRKSYGKFMYFVNKTIGKSFIGKGLKKFKRFVKVSMNHTAIIDELGLKYVGIFNGHKIKELIRILTNIKNSGRPTLLHVRTVKGRGMKSAEENSSAYHGVGKNLSTNSNSFSDSVSVILCKKAKDRDDITAICAGMKDGVGLGAFAEEYPDRFFDVGIAEEHAVTFAAGQALGGLRPVVCIYSTFLQRSYDQIMYDVCAQNLPVIFFIDRAGAVGSDGETHQGLFDLTYLRSMPNMSVFAPKNCAELEMIFEHCLDLGLPCAIRYPNGTVAESETVENQDVGRWEIVKDGDVILLCVGPRMIGIGLEISEKSEKNVGVVNARMIKPLDEDFLLAVKDKRIIVMEDNSVVGGFGSAVLEFYAEKGVSANVKLVGFPCDFIKHASVKEQFDDCGLTADDIIKKYNL